MASTHILAVGKIEQGEVVLTKHAYIEYLCSMTQDDEPADGALQATIDYAAELQELEDDILDREFWAGGGW